MDRTIFLSSLSMTAIMLVCVTAGPVRSEGTEVKLDDLSSTTPADWKSIKPDNRLRKYQFELPLAEGDKGVAEVAVLPNFGGDSENKVARWKRDFLPPEGKTIDQVSTVKEFQLGKDNEGTILDIRGTWVYKERPFDPKSQPVVREGYRVIWVILDTKLDTFQIRLSGPEKTVAKHKEAFDAWLKGFEK